MHIIAQLFSVLIAVYAYNTHSHDMHIIAQLFSVLIAVYAYIHIIMTCIL